MEKKPKSTINDRGKMSVQEAVGYGHDKDEGRQSKHRRRHAPHGAHKRKTLRDHRH